MKKIRVILIGTLTCFMTTSVVMAQTETFDIMTYTAPRGFTKTMRKGVVTYSNVDTAAGRFCVISIYASRPAAGDAASIFKKEWKDLAVTPFKAIPNPETETQSTPDGWQLVTGISPIKESNIDCYLILTVVSGFGKTVTIRSSMNDPSYSAQIDALFTTMELDKTKSATVSNDVIEPATTSNSTGKFGLMTYTAPAGWSEQVFADGIVFKPLDLAAGEHLAIQIMQPLQVSGSLQQVLAQSFEEATIMYKATSMYQSDGKYGKNEPKKAFTGWEYLRGKGGIRIQDGTSFGTEYGLEVFVIKVNNRFERVAILESRKNCNLSRYYASDRLSYRNAIEKLLYSFRFADFDASVLKPGTVHGSGVVGIWQGIIQSTSAPGFQIDTYSLILLNNGQVYFGEHFPTEGLDGLNTRIPPELHRRDWKTYTYNNGHGMMNMIFADIPFRTEGDKLIVTKNKMEWPYFKLKSVTGATFSGTYIMKELNGKIPAITFTADGRFTDNGALRVLYHQYVDCINPALLPGSGTYEVKDYTVHFNYTDGRKIKLAFMGTDYNKANPSPPTLRMSFDDNEMTRQ
jgi:hypothetical protein